VSRLGTWLRYSAVSVVATLVGVLVLGVLVTLTRLSPGWSNVVATAVGTIPSFELNRRWVWGQRGARSLRREVMPFGALSFAGLAMSTWTVDTVAEWAAGSGLEGLVRTAAIQLAHLAGFGLLWVLQFVILDRFLFRSAGQDSSVSDSICSPA
jgi:putative flippase GtrA